jgi:hypothetical protein
MELKNKGFVSQMDTLVNTMNTRRRCCMTDGSNHAAVFFTHKCPYKGAKLRGK